MEAGDFSWSSILIGIGLTTIFLLYLHIKWTNGIFKRLGIAGPEPGFFGVLKELSQKGIVGFDPDLMEKYGRVVGTFHGRKPIMFVADPDMIKEIFVKEFLSFPDRGVFMPEDDVLRNSLPNIRDLAHWRLTRGALTTVFTSGKLKRMSPLLQRCLKNLVNNFEEKSRLPSVNVEKLFASYVMDSIGTTGFGADVDSQRNPDNEFVLNAKKSVNFSFASIVLVIGLIVPWSIRLLELLNVRQLPPSSAKKFFSSFVHAAIEERKKEQSNRRDFLQLALNGHKESLDEGSAQQMERGLTEDEILANALFFLTAGYNTTTITMTFLAHSLALHQDIQERLYREIQDNIGQEELNYENVMGLTYLDMVVNETMRKYPPAARLARRAARDMEVKGYAIPKDMTVFIPTFHVHRNPDFWPNPEEFDPERFLQKNKDHFNPYCFLPFGIGPRSCIGNRLAILNIKMVTVALVRKFRFVQTPETEVVIEIARGGFIKPKNPVMLRIEPRT